MILDNRRLILLIIRRSDWSTICSSWSIGMISLTLNQSVIYSFLILDVSWGWKMTISLGIISLCLYVILSIFLLSGIADCIRLTCCSMCIYLFFIYHFQFLWIFNLVSICCWQRYVIIIDNSLSSMRGTCESILSKLIISSIWWAAL